MPKHDRDDDKGTRRAYPPMPKATPPPPKPPPKPEPEPEPPQPVPEPPKPEPPKLVYCTECTHLRFTKQSVELGFEPLCAAVARPNQFIARSGPLSYEKCSVVNPDGHCQYYTQQTPPRPGFWNFAFGESQP